MYQYNQKSMFAVFAVLVVTATSSVRASNTIKITNSATVPVIFVLVPTELSSDQRSLYAGPSGMKADAVAAAVANIMKSTKAIVLNPGESSTIANLPQNISEYNRTAWIVPLPLSEKTSLEANLHALANAIESRNMQYSYAFEVGSAKTAQIVGDKNDLSLNTTGKLLGGVKSMFKTSKTPGTAGTTRGYTINQLKHGTATSSIMAHIKNWENMVAQPKKSKPPTPRRNQPSSSSKAAGASKSSVSKNGDPEGWPSGEFERPFNETMGILGIKLNSPEAKQLRDYKNINDPADRKTLIRGIQGKFDRPTRPQVAAIQRIRLYARGIYGDSEDALIES